MRFRDAALAQSSDCGDAAGWSQVRDLIARLLEESAFGTATSLVARSLLGAIKARIAVEPPDPTELAVWLESHAPLVTGIAAGLRDRIPGAKLTKAGGAGFVGHRVHVPDVLGSELRRRIYATPAGAALNLVGEPDALIVGIERDAGETLESPASDVFAEAGFLKERDIAGNRMHRRAWPMQDAIAEPGAVGASIWEALSATAIEPWRHVAAVDAQAPTRRGPLES
jgi:hypothetical protein